MLLMLTSCRSTYSFYQVYETQPTVQNSCKTSDHGTLRYEDPLCAIDYYFWSNGGSASFEFYNKTEEIIYIELDKSFFIKNGHAYDLYKGREWSNSSTTGIATTSSNGLTLSTGLITSIPVSTQTSRASVLASSSSSSANTETNTTTFVEQNIVAIPPHSSKYIETYSMTSQPLLSCDLTRYPSQNARLTFTADNSPLTFSNYITFIVGEKGQTKTIKNEFYVSSVTNYAEPEIVVFRERPEVCENMKDGDAIPPMYVLYDKYIKSNVCAFNSSFYQFYQTTSTKKLYKSKDSYVYKYAYNAYVKGF